MVICKKHISSQCLIRDYYPLSTVMLWCWTIGLCTVLWCKPFHRKSNTVHHLSLNWHYILKDIKVVEMLYFWLVAYQGYSWLRFNFVVVRQSRFVDGFSIKLVEFSIDRNLVNLILRIAWTKIVFTQWLFWQTDIRQQQSSLFDIEIVQCCKFSQPKIDFDL